MESGTLSATPAPKRSTNNHAPCLGCFLRDVGRNSGPLRGTIHSASSQLPQPLWHKSTHPQLELGARFPLRGGLRRRERTVASGEPEPPASRRTPVTPATNP